MAVEGFANQTVQSRPRKANPCQEICCHVLINAYRDLISPVARHRRGALEFFESGMYQYWSIFAGIAPNIAYRRYIDVMEGKEIYAEE